MQVQAGVNFKILMEHLAKLNLKLISKDTKASFQRWKITLKSTTLNSIPVAPLVWKLWNDNHDTGPTVGESDDLQCGHIQRKQNKHLSWYVHRISLSHVLGQPKQVKRYSVDLSLYLLM
jgi:hypothetical protein